MTAVGWQVTVCSTTAPIYTNLHAYADKHLLIVVPPVACARAADDWKRLVPARNAMIGILQAKFAEHKLRSSVQHIERRTVHKVVEPLPAEGGLGQPIY